MSTRPARPSAPDDEREFAVEALIARLLFWGGLVSIALVVLGLGLYAVHGGFHAHTPLPQRIAVTASAHGPGVFVSIPEVVHGLRADPPDPLAVITLGLVLLLMTPVLGVAVAIPGFLVAADRRYAAVATIVFAMLVLSGVLAGGAG